MDKDYANYRYNISLSQYRALSYKEKRFINTSLHYQHHHFNLIGWLLNLYCNIYSTISLEDDNKFSFLSHPFILAITAKQIGILLFLLLLLLKFLIIFLLIVIYVIIVSNTGLYFDNRIQMYEERRTSLLQNVFSLGSYNYLIQYFRNPF